MDEHLIARWMELSGWQFEWHRYGETSFIHPVLQNRVRYKPYPNYGHGAYESNNWPRFAHDAPAWLPAFQHCEFYVGWRTHSMTFRKRWDHTNLVYKYEDENDVLKIHTEQQNFYGDTFDHLFMGYLHGEDSSAMLDYLIENDWRNKGSILDKYLPHW